MPGIILTKVLYTYTHLHIFPPTLSLVISFHTIPFAILPNEYFSSQNEIISSHFNFRLFPNQGHLVFDTLFFVCLHTSKSQYIRANATTQATITQHFKTLRLFYFRWVLNLNNKLNYALLI